MDRFVVAMSKYKRQKYDECIDICTELLEKNQYDQATWLLKCRALTMKNYIDDLEIDEEGVADILMDDNAMATAPRPGTSFSRPTTSAGGSGISQNVRPMSNSGRPISGYMRPGTNRVATGQSRGKSPFKINRQYCLTSNDIIHRGINHSHEGKQARNSKTSDFRRPYAAYRYCLYGSNRGSVHYGW